MFTGIIGHRAVKKFLEQSICSGRLTHAYLFLGQQQVGKMTIARACANHLLGQNENASLETHPDVTIVERLVDEKSGELKSNITIGQIRALRERLSQSTLLPGWKIAIVDDGETITTEGANALLKTLEEPRGQTIIFLLARDARFIPDTIRSRCQVVRFGLVSRAEIAEVLEQQGASKIVAEQISRMACGRPGEAMRFFRDADALKERSEGIETRTNLLQDPVYVRMKWIEAHVKGKKGKAFDEECALWREILHDVLVRGLESSLYASDQDAGGIHVIARALRNLIEAEDAAHYHVDARLALEHAICFD